MQNLSPTLILIDRFETMIRLCTSVLLSNIEQQDNFPDICLLNTSHLKNIVARYSGAHVSDAAVDDHYNIDQSYLQYSSCMFDDALNP